MLYVPVNHITISNVYYPGPLIATRPGQICPGYPDIVGDIPTSDPFRAFLIPPALPVVVTDFGG